MPEAEGAPQEEPDVPSEELDEMGMSAVVALAEAVVERHREFKAVLADIQRLEGALLPAMREKELHGIRLQDGTAVRRRWSPNRPTIDPVKLAAKLADAPDYIEVKVTVDQQRLKVDYPELWREFGGKAKETIVVAESSRLPFVVPNKESPKPAF